MTTPSPSVSPRPDSKWTVRGVCILLAGAVAVVFGRTLWFDFINFDDPDYVTSNPQVLHGLTWSGIVWAFHPGHGDYWHPLTWLSLMLDVSLFGRGPGGFHLTNVLLHAANSVLVFLLLQSWTGALWRSALVGALFALHPLRVESVAWITERKDVLSTLFWLLTLWAYGRYAQNKATLNPQHSTINYTLALIFFVLGLMSKAMLVTLPFVLLLLDYWPLGRVVTCGPSPLPSSPACDAASRSAAPGSWESSGRKPVWWGYVRSWRPLIMEKLPFFALAVASGVVTFWGQQKVGAVATLANLPVSSRVENVFVVYASYLGQTFWPAGLAVYYPYPGQWPWWELVWAVALVAGLCAAALRLGREHPYVLTGWFWFLGTLVPVSGLVRTGSQFMADRFTYVPLTGVFIILAWGASEVCLCRRWSKTVMGVGAGLVLAACTVCTWNQLSHWRNSGTLFRHALDVTPPNFLPHMKLGELSVERGEIDEAVKQFKEALKIDGEGLEPDARRSEEAPPVNPRHAYMHWKIADALARQGKVPESIGQYYVALRCQPDFSEALNNLAWTLATSPDANVRDGRRAVQLAERACALTDFKQTIFVGTLAATYAEAGRFDDAIATAQKACALAAAAGDQDLLKRNQELLASYFKHQPYHETVEKTVPAAP